MNTLFDLPANNDPKVYVDPFPGRTGSESVREDCGYCNEGVYPGPSGHTWEIPGKGSNKWCYRCNGRGYFMVKISSVRARVRRQANQAAKNAKLDAEYAAKRPALEWLEAERVWKEAVTEWLKEETRVTAMTQGFVAEIGTRIKNVEATVTVAMSFEVPAFNYGTQWKAMVVLTTENGKVLKTTGTGDSLYGLEKGQKVTITGTVKAHAVYRQQDQTVLTRVKVIPID